MPKVSIIIPSYNSSIFIKRTIESVIHQSFTEWELLVVDDCSTDNTREILEEISKKDPRIKILKTPTNSGGPATPKNIGLKEAKGEYVAFLDHDDEWMPEKIEKQLKLFENSNNNKLGLVSCFFNIKDNDTEEIIYKNNKLYRGDVIKFLKKANFLVTSSCIITKLSIFKNVGFFDKELKISDDWDMWIKISEAGYDFDFSEEYLVNYIVHGNNACYGNNNFNEKKEFALFHKKHLDLFKDDNYINGYYYNTIQNYKLSRKNYLIAIFSKKSTKREIIKSIAYIILSFYPSLEKSLKKIWRKIK